MKHYIVSHPQGERSSTFTIIREWLPLTTLTSAALVMDVPEARIRMLLIAAAIYLGFKWVTWLRSRRLGIETTIFRSLAYLFLWPGMDARAFLSANKTIPPPSARSWIWSATKVGLGILLIWGCARFVENDWEAGWIGMIGLMFLLHFGVLEMLAFFWQQQGICARPLMSAPFLATSLREFWGRRWNSGFRIIAFDLMFRPLTRRMSPSAAMIGTFLISGFIHDLVVSVPIHYGYGRPTAYFLIQGLGILIERSGLGRRLLRPGTLIARTFTLSVLILPVGWLFPPTFVEKIITPFLRTIGAFSWN